MNDEVVVWTKINKINDFKRVLHHSHKFLIHNSSVMTLLLVPNDFYQINSHQKRIKPMVKLFLFIFSLLVSCFSLIT